VRIIAVDAKRRSVAYGEFARPKIGLRRAVDELRIVNGHCRVTVGDAVPPKTRTVTRGLAANRGASQTLYAPRLLRPGAASPGGAERLLGLVNRARSCPPQRPAWVNCTDTCLSLDQTRAGG